MWKKCWRDRRDLFPEEKSFIYPSETVLGWMGQRSSLLRETRGNKVTELSSRSKLIGCCSVWHPGVQHHRSVCGLSWRLLYHTPGLSYLLFTGCAISGGRGRTAVQGDSHPTAKSTRQEVLQCSNWKWSEAGNWTKSQQRAPPANIELFMRESFFITALLGPSRSPSGEVVVLASTV